MGPRAVSAGRGGQILDFEVMVLLLVPDTAARNFNSENSMLRSGSNPTPPWPGWLVFHSHSITVLEARATRDAAEPVRWSSSMWTMWGRLRQL